MIKIDQDRCIGCMACLSVCPFSALEEVEGKPELVDFGRCLRCMHCGAACPTEAITYREEPTILLEKPKAAGDEFVKDLRSLILQRRSYRHFSEEQVPRGIIEEALDLASWAPSAKNQHSTKWLIIESQETIAKIMDAITAYVKETGTSPEIITQLELGNNVVMGTATTLLLAYASDLAVSPETDTAIAMATAELYLQAKGVGTCWAGYLKRMCNTVPEIKALLPKLPRKYSFYGAFMLGYPEGEQYLHIPQRFKRADIKWV